MTILVVLNNLVFLAVFKQLFIESYLNEDFSFV